MSQLSEQQRELGEYIVDMTRQLRKMTEAIGIPVAACLMQMAATDVELALSNNENASLSRDLR